MSVGLADMNLNNIFKHKEEVINYCNKVVKNHKNYVSTDGEEDSSSDSYTTFRTSDLSSDSE